MNSLEINQLFTWLYFYFLYCIYNFNKLIYIENVKLITGRHTMVFVTKRRMKSSSTSGLHQNNSLDSQLLEIDSLYLQCDKFEGWYEKGMIHDWLKKEMLPRSILRLTRSCSLWQVYLPGRNMSVQLRTEVLMTIFSAFLWANERQLIPSSRLVSSIWEKFWITKGCSFAAALWSGSS